MLARFLRTLRTFAGRGRFESSMEDELRFHMEQYASELTRSGVPAAEAFRRAKIEFGGVNTVKEDCRRARGLELIDACFRELRLASRSLRKNAVLSATAVLTLALCGGANLTIFAVVDAVLLRALPFPQSDRLVTIFNTYPKAGVERDGSSLTNYYERRGKLQAFSSLSIYRLGNEVTGEPGATERLDTTEVSPDFFATLGRGPVLGRPFHEEETYFENNRVAILSNAYWVRKFNRNPNVLGRRIWVNAQPVSVVGVLPESFHFLSSQSAIYLPLASRPEDRSPVQRHSGGNLTQMIARLRPGTSVAQAQAEIDAQNTALEQDDPQAKAMADAGFRSMIVPLHADHVASFRPMLLLLQAGVLLLFLIGTVNLANLLLIQASARTKEIAVRQALGSSRMHLISHILTQTTVLAVAGGLFGIVLGLFGVQLLKVLGSERLPLGAQISFDVRVAALGFAASILTGLVLAVPVIWFHLRRPVDTGLKSETRSGSASHTAEALRRMFTVAQVSLSFVLLVGAGLLGLGLNRVMGVSPGFQPEHVVSAQISFIGDRYSSPSSALNFIDTLVTRLENRPGMSAAGVIDMLPFGGRDGKSAAFVVGYVRRPGQAPHGHYSYGVGGDYFRAMGYTLAEGRFLDARDGRGQRVCVVDLDFARHYWGHQSPIGRRLFQGSAPGSDAEAFTVVGVVAPVKQAGLTEDAGQGAVYYPFLHHANPRMFVVARSAAASSLAAGTVRGTIHSVDPLMQIDDLRSMDSRIADSLVSRRSPALLAALFSGIALLLTAVGLYGTISHSTLQRRREIAVRMAVGASPSQIRGQFLRDGGRMLLMGAAVGLVGAWFAGQAMRTLLFGVSPFNVTVIGTCVAVITTIAAVSSLIPATRASRTAPADALIEN